MTQKPYMPLRQASSCMSFHYAHFLPPEHIAPTAQARTGNLAACFPYIRYRFSRAIKKAFAISYADQQIAVLGIVVIILGFSPRK